MFPETVYVIALSPFVSNDDGCVDGAGEGDVVEGVEQLGEDVGVQGGRVTQGPLPYWNRAMLNNPVEVFYSKYFFCAFLSTKFPIFIQEANTDSGGPIRIRKHQYGFRVEGGDNLKKIQSFHKMNQ